MRKTLMVLAAVVALALTGTAAAAARGYTAGVGALQEGGHLGNIVNPNLYAMLVGGAWGSDVGSVVETASGLGLVYFDGTDVRATFDTGVPYSRALSNGWLLKDASGHLLFNSSYGSYCADVGSAGYRQAWISNVEKYLSSHPGVDGIFIDNALLDPKADCGAYPARYPTTAAWDTAMVSFVSAVYQALHPLGYYVALNAGAYKAGDATYNDGTSTVAWWKQVGPYADGLMNEGYDQTSHGPRSSANAWYGDFDGWQRLIPTAQQMGVDWLGLMRGSSTDTALMTYGKASFLLEWNGQGSAFMYQAGASDPTNSAWTTDIGTPVASKVAVGVGYERSYTKGTILVNPSPSSSQTFRVGGTSYRLPPVTARIIAG